MNIFLKDKRISFIPAGAEALQDKTLYLKYDGPASLATSFNELEKDEAVTHLIIGCTDIGEAFSQFQKMFRVITAAGGLVQNKAGEYLVIFRKGKWDLPKGKLDKDESPSEAALREVEEECGIGSLSIVKELPSTYHIYEEKGSKILKHSIWYAMLCKDGQAPKPQSEEGITEAKWLKKEDAEKALSDSFPAIREMALPQLRAK